MAGEVVGVDDRLQVVQQLLLNTLERYLFLDECSHQLLEPLPVLILVLFSGKALAHVKPLKATYRKRRFHGRDHHWDYGQVATVGARQFVEAVTIGTANRMRRHQEQETSAFSFFRNELESLSNVLLPISTRLQAVNIEPHFMAQRPQIVLNA
jgi:hypothetical protein